MILSLKLIFMFNKLKSFKYLPFLYILLVWSIFATPYFIKEKVPYPSNYQVNSFTPWSSYEEFWGPVKNNAMPDIITQIYPWRYFTIEQWKKGQIPLWNPYSFSGTPHLANYQSAVLSPFNLLFFAFSFVDAWTLLVLLQPLLAGVFMFLFVRTLNRSIIASLICSISFMFCGFITSWMGYATLDYAILFLPLSLFAIEKFCQHKNFWYLILLSLSIPLSFFSGHFQISLYFLIFIIIYIFYKFIAIRNIHNILYITLYTTFGLFLSLPQILPSMEFYNLSVRSNIFQKMEIIPWNYLPTLLAPDFFGNPVTRNDWFGHYAEWNGYVGVIPFLLAIYSLIKMKVKQKKYLPFLFFSIMSILTLLSAYNSPFVDFLTRFKIPVLSTSAASRMIVLFSFSMAILAGFGFDSLVEDLKNKKQKQIVIWLLFSCLIFIVLWVIVFLKLIPDPSKIFISKSNLILSTAFFASFIVIICFSILLKNTAMNFLIRNKTNAERIFMLLLILVMLIVSFDMLRFVTKWMPFDPKEFVFIKTSVSEFFPKIMPFERVMGNYEAGEGVYYNLSSIEGYDPLYIKKYGEFIKAIEGNGLSEPYRSVVAFPRQTKNSFTAINLLGVKYMIHKKSDEGAGWTFPVWKYDENELSPVFEDNKFEIYKNNKSMSRAVLVSNYKVIKSPEKIIDEVFSGNFDYENQVIVEEDPLVLKKELKIKQAEIRDYSSNYVDIRTKSDQDSLLLVTDNYYPGWKAYVDGKVAKIFRADYTFRSIVVPKGEHDVEFVYEPDSFRVGIYAAIIGLFGIILLGLMMGSKSKVKI